MTGIAIVLAALLTEPPPSVVIPLDASEATRAAVSALERDLAASGEVLMDSSQTRRSLGLAALRRPSVQAVLALAADAREREAYFDSEGAQALRRQALEAFDAAPIADPELCRAAAEVQTDIASTWFTGNRMDLAVVEARELWRRFDPPTLDRQRIPPHVITFLKAQRDALAGERRSRLTLDVGAPGQIQAECIRLGEVSVAGHLDVQLASGEYRIWLRGEEGWTVPQALKVGTEAQAVGVARAPDLRVNAEGAWYLACGADCTPGLAAVAARAGVVRVHGVRASSPEKAEVLVFERGKRSAERTTFGGKRLAGISPLLFVPFGAAQFSERRYVAGGVYLGVELGLIVWHVASRIKYAQAHDAMNYDRAESFRQQANASLALVVGVTIATVVEALVVHAVSPDQPSGL